MIITRIDVSISGRNGAYQRGHVVFEIQEDDGTEPRLLHLHASARAPASAPAQEMEALLAEDAIARLRRMPDVKRVTLRLADGSQPRFSA
ncbi:hypothetical protein PSA7680_02226 [Pseudoruegeria aquimaris]|uniref:Uncharacterized protein n=1 Tax=Pseudoruegeria aquimaris TaxID=393663 RepID=A0A1Y5SM51_9RHOB|nr:hypothetical protein [Pseudoruegeria aquimaris]SLN43904.1 hypothetical protein PSA7680_02226 [Pseudoruegeria aquimaris]